MPVPYSILILVLQMNEHRVYSHRRDHHTAGTIDRQAYSRATYRLQKLPPLPPLLIPSAGVTPTPQRRRVVSCVLDVCLRLGDSAILPSAGGV